MSIQIGPRIVSDSSLLLYLNAGYAGSYSGTGTTWYDMSPNLNHVIDLGATYDSRGYFDFNGYQSGSLTNAIDLPDTFTVDALLQSYDLSQGSGVLNSATSDTLLNPYEAYGGQIRSSTGGVSTRWAYGPSNVNIQKNTWYNFAITNDSDVYKVYKNGVYMGSSGYIGKDYTVPDEYTPYQNMARIGARGYGATGTHFSGSLATLRVYNRVLSDAEIAQNHAAFRK